MKKLYRFAITAVCVAASVTMADAQYYSIANQVTSMLQPVLSGSLNYKGFVEAEYIQGVGNNKANFLNFTTSQGMRYSNWFYMGVGAGANIVFAEADGYQGHGTATNTGVMIPLFSDFRFNIGNSQSNATSFFIDLKLGGAFLIGSNHLAVGNGYINSNEYFYLRPAIGLRLPVSKDHPKQAVDIGLSYQLLTGNNYCYWGGGHGGGLTLNGFGANVAFEW